MTTGEKIQLLRKQNNFTQEQLADLLNVSRQSISKWESDLAWPETDKLIKLSELFKVSVDFLLKENPVKETKDVIAKDLKESFHYEFKSKRIIFGKPLVHINLGLGFYKANGIISIGNIAKGFLSIGICSMGLLSLGVFSLGIIALGAFTLGGLALGAISLGIIAIGAIAVGLFSIGAISVGYFSVGALSIAKYVAIGDKAYGEIAIGKTYASGSVYQVIKDSNTNYQEEAKSIIDSNVPSFWKFFIDWIKIYIK